MNIHWINVSRLIVLGFLAISSGCVKERNFKDPAQRVTNGAAYIMPSKQVAAGMGFFGQGTHDLGVRAGVAVGIADVAQVRVNAAHAAFGVVNLDTKFNFVDREKWALGASLGFLWVHPKAIWVLPDETRDAFSEMDIITIPFMLNSSFPVLDWMSLHLAVGYIHSQLFGQYQDSTSFLDTSIGRRQIVARPKIDFHVAKRVLVFVQAQLLLYGLTYGELSTVIDVEPGVVAGARSQGWEQMDFIEGTHFTIGTEVRFGNTTHFRVWIMYNGMFSNSELIDRSWLPGFDLYWRFGGGENDKK